MARVLALDFGEKRIGVAISDPSGLVARPLTTIFRTSGSAPLQDIEHLVDEYEVERILVGLPLSLDGTEGPQARRTRRFATELSQVLSVPIEFWDERFSSAAAEEILKGRSKPLWQMGRQQRRRARAKVDATAAAVILQSYLDAQAPAWNGTS